MAECNIKKVMQLENVKYKPETIKVWNSILEAAENLGINASGISKCCRGKQKTAGGYKWKFVEKL